MEDFPTDLRNMHQFRNYSCFPTTRAEPLTLRLLRLAMNVFSTIIYFPLIYFSSCPNYCLLYLCFSMSAVIQLDSKLQVRVETWICLLAVDLTDLWLNHGAASAPACSVGGWLYFFILSPVLFARYSKRLPADLTKARSTDSLWLRFRSGSQNALPLQ